MRWISTLVVIVGLFATSLLGHGMSPLALAQDGMTTADLPVTPGPELCMVEPRPLAFFEQYVGTPSPPSDEDAAEIAGSLDSFVPPEGQPADPETIDAVVATTVEVVACFNAGDLSRAFALYSDDLIADFAAADPLPQEVFDAMAATPTAAPADQRSSILVVRDVILLDDGRVGGLIDFEFETGYHETQYAVLTLEGDRWLVDEILLFAPSEATPTP